MQILLLPEGKNLLVIEPIVLLVHELKVEFKQDLCEGKAQFVPCETVRKNPILVNVYLRMRGRIGEAGKGAVK